MEVVIEKAAEAPKVEVEQEEPVENKPVEDAVEPAVAKDEQVKTEPAEQPEDESTVVEEKDSMTVETKELNGLQKKKRENIKFDATLLPESDDPAEVRKQVQ